MGAPTNVTLTPSDGEITVEWEPPTQTGGRIVTSYRVVYYPTAAGSSQATGQSDSISLSSRSKTITGLTNGTSYSVYMFATYTGGSGTSSSTLQATPVPPPPGAPSALAQTPGDAQIDLTWTAPSMGTVTSYDYSTDDGASWRTTGSTAASYTATHTSASTSTALVNGTEYTVRVRGRNTGGPGPQSNSIKATPRTVPAQVVISGTTHGDEQVTITWTAPSNGGSAITGYDYRIGATGGAQDVGNADISTTSVTIGSLTNGTEYQLYIRAVNAAGNGPWSAASAETPSTTPEAPQDIASVGADAQVALSWTAPADGGKAITSYDYSSDGGGSWKTTGSTTTTYTATHTSASTSTALVNGTEYLFQVRGVNSNGAGVPSQSSASTPHEPSSVSGIAVFAINLTTATIVASIQNSFGEESTVDFEYKKDSASIWQSAGSAVGVTSSSYDITGLTPSTDYDMRARIGTTPYATGSFTTEANHTTGIDVTSSTGTAAVIEVSFTNPLSATLNVYLRTKPLAGAWSATATNSESSTTSTFTIINLTSGTDYQVEASLDSSFPSAATVSIDFDPGAPLAADSEFITQYVEIIVTPEDPVPASGSATGFRKGDLSVGFGEADPDIISAFGAPFDVLAIQQTGTDITFSINPCPTTWEMHSMRIEELNPLTGAPTSSVSIISLGYFCSDRTATWTAAGVTAYALGGTSSGGNNQRQEGHPSSAIAVHQIDPTGRRDRRTPPWNSQRHDMRSPGDDPRRRVLWAAHDIFPPLDAYRDRLLLWRREPSPPVCHRRGGLYRNGGPGSTRTYYGGGIHPGGGGCRGWDGYTEEIEDN